MGDLVDSLPAEYRTESLGSLPRDLQIIAVKNIRKKFGLKDPEIEEKKRLDSSFARMYKTTAEAIKEQYEYIGPDQFMIDPYKAVQVYDLGHDDYGRRFRRCLQVTISPRYGGLAIAQVHIDVEEGMDWQYEAMRQAGLNGSPSHYNFSILNEKRY